MNENHQEHKEEPLTIPLWPDAGQMAGLISVTRLTAPPCLDRLDDRRSAHATCRAQNRTASCRTRSFIGFWLDGILLRRSMTKALTTKTRGILRRRTLLSAAEILAIC